MPDPKHGNLMKIIRITIKGSSGYCPVDIAFHDRISLTPHSIEYTYQPAYMCKMNIPAGGSIISRGDRTYGNS